MGSDHVEFSFPSQSQHSLLTSQDPAAELLPVNVAGASSWLELDQAAFYHNLQYLKDLIGPTVKLAVVAKSNAYGCGLTQIAPLCQASTAVAYLAVFSVAEALSVRAQGFTKPLLVLGFYGWDQAALARAIAQQIDLIVYEPAQLAQLQSLAAAAGQIAQIQIKVDTGLARLGFTPAAVQQIFLAPDFPQRFPNLQLAGIFTHLAVSEQPEAPISQQQLAQLIALVQQAKQQQRQVGLVHAAGSACAFLTSAAHFDLVRIGGMAYGLSKFPNPNLKFILRWYTRVIQLKQLAAQTPVGYGQTFVTTRPTTIAVLPVGYTDGYDRRLSNCGQVLISGVLAPVVGRVAMNLVTVDVTDVPAVTVGTLATLLGPTPGIRPADWAAAAGSYIYETVVHLNPKLPRLLS